MVLIATNAARERFSLSGARPPSTGAPVASLRLAPGAHRHPHGEFTSNSRQIATQFAALATGPIIFLTVLEHRAP